MPSTVLPQGTTFYVGVGDTRTGSVAVQPHMCSTVQAGIDHTLRLSDEIGNRAFDRFIVAGIDKDVVEAAVTMWQNKFLAARDAMVDDIQVLLAPVAGVDVWSGNADTDKFWR